MTNNRSRRMEPVVQVAHERQQSAARRLGDRQRALDSHLHRLEELESFQQEYLRRFDADTGGGMSAISIRDYRLFLSRINEAIEQQTHMIEIARKELEASRHQWMQTKIKSDAINKAVDRFRKEEQDIRERREQHENDERCQQLFLRKKNIIS